MDMLIVNLRTELPPYYGKRGYVETGTAAVPRDHGDHHAVPLHTHVEGAPVGEIPPRSRPSRTIRSGSPASTANSASCVST